MWALQRVGTKLKITCFAFAASPTRTNEWLRFFRVATHDSLDVQSAVRQIALVGVKRRPYFILRLLLRAFARLELSIAAFADADGWQRRLHDPKFARVHDQSLAHRRAGVEISGNQGETARGRQEA